jgi:hypothetical protein
MPSDEERARDIADQMRDLMADGPHSVGSLPMADVLLAAFREVRAEERQRWEMLAESQYRAGMKAGWNFAQDDNGEAKFSAAMNGSIRDHAAAIRAAKEGEK